MHRLKSIELNVRQMGALQDPRKRDIFEAVHCGGAATATEIGLRVGRPAKSLYYHLRALIECGLLLQTGTVPAGKRTQAVYDSVAQSLFLPEETEANRATINRSVVSIMRLAEREFIKASKQAVAHPEIIDHMICSRRVVRLSPENFRKYHDLLQQAWRFATESEGNAEGEVVALTNLIVPKVP